MHSPATLLTLAVAAAGTASAGFSGFNYGSTGPNGPKNQADFERDFKAAQNLKGTNGIFNSARLYTMVQAGTANDPISAIPAAISTKTSLLFGLWASAGQESFNNELAALKKTIDQYCGKLDGLVAGISVGSEDLYRISVVGMSRDKLPGASPSVLAGYIKSVRDTIKGSCLKDAPIGHVDTWTSFANSTNQPLIDAVDWLGMDTYPYFEDDKPNAIGEGSNLFNAALEKVKVASKGKPVWVTETGWPVTGETFGKAVPSNDNAKDFWQKVGCPMFGKTNVWWYTLQDIGAPQPNFGVVGANLNEPNFDLSCKGHENPPAVSSTPPTPPSSSGKETKSQPPASSSAPASSNPAPSSAPGSSSKPAGTTGGGANPTTMNTAPASNSQGATSPASTPGATQSSQQPGSSPTPTKLPGDSGAGNLNAVGAAAVALMMAVALL